MPLINLGRVGFVNKGTWVDGVHKVNDLAQYGTSTYACILAHTSTLGDIIPTNATYWQKWTDYGSHTVSDIASTVIASADSQYVNAFTGLNTGVLSIKITGLVTATASTVDNGFMEITITQDDRDHTLGTNPPSYKFIVKADMDAGVWYNAQAQIIGSTATSPINVRFTRNASDAFIEIGEVASSWYYPVVELSHTINSNIVGFTPVFLATIQASILGTTTDFIIATNPPELGVIINSLTAKTTPIDADAIGIWDSVSGLARKVTGTNWKAYLKAYFDTVYITGAIGTRQTVQSGSVDTSGFANFLSIGTGLNVNIAATTTPVVVHMAGGAISNDVLVTISADTSLLLGASVTSYITLNSSGTLGSLVLAPIYQFGGTPSVTNGQFTYNISEGKAYLGNGTTAPNVLMTVLGEAVTSGSAVTSVVTYALNGLYDSGFTATLPAGSSSVVKNSNLGVKPSVASIIIECTTADNGYAVGDSITVSTGGSTGQGTWPLAYTNKVISFSTNASAIAFIPKNGAGGSNVALTSASWKYKIIANRGW